ncbi:MAG: homoserine kinase [Myxococcales bacterium]
MALHVLLGTEELEAALEPFGVSRVLAVRGLPQGSLNTNHRVETDRGPFFARLAFGRKPAELTFEASLLDALRGAQLPVVPPRRTAGGEPAVPLRGGLLSLFPWAAGEHLAAAAVEQRHLWELGRVLGRLRRLGGAFPLQRENPYGPAVVGAWLAEFEASAGRGEAEVAAALPLLRRGLERGKLGLAAGGLAHGDLFRDNVLWLGDRISALLDFEMACTAPAALDPAVTLLDWAWEEGPGDGRFSPARARALADGYRGTAGREAVSAAELAPALAFAACRFTLSRLRDFHFSELPPEALVRKDWREMRARLAAALELDGEGAKALWG